MSADKNAYALTVSADEAFLTDPTTVYPVTIDPDLTIQDTASSAGLVEDATIGDRYAEKTFYVTSITHTELVGNADVLAFVNDIINGTNTILPNTITED